MRTGIAVSAAIRITLLVGIAALTRVPRATAQDVVTGTPPFGTFQSFGPSVLNLGNLNTQIAIPIFSRPGRGAGLSYSLVYDNSVWAPHFDTVPVEMWTWQPRPQFGWHGISEGVTGYLSYDENVQPCPGPPPKPPGQIKILTKFVYHDALGVSHAFANRAVVDLTQTCGYSESITDQIASDGSGYILNFHPNGDGPTDVRFVDGTVIDPPHNDPGGSGSVMDANGNVVSSIMANGQGTIRDTLGTTALTVSGQAPNPVSLTYSDANGSPRTITLLYEARTVKTNFGCSIGVDQIIEYVGDARPLLTRVVFPDQSFYAFTYEATPGDPSSVTGRIASVTLPTGAAIRYDYTGDNNGIVCQDGSTSGVDITTADGGFWRYRRAASGSSWISTATDPAGNQTASTFSAIYRTQMLAYAGTAGGPLLRSLVTCYNATGTSCLPGNVTLPIGSRTSVTTLDDNRKAAATTIYSSGGLPVYASETDFGLGSPGPLLRLTTTTYASLGPHLLSRPSVITVYDAQSSRVAETRFVYDDTPLIATSGLPQHQLVTTPRGNLTGQSQWLDTGGDGALRTTIYQYDDAGMVRSVTDPGGHVTTYAYADDWGSASACLPPANTGAFTTDVGNALGQHVLQQYYPCTGSLESLRDPNDVNDGRPGARFAYDLMNRPVSAGYPDNGQTFVSYPDPNHVSISKSIDDFFATNAQIEVDAYGRPSRFARMTQQGVSFDVQDVCYDSMGRIAFQSYPYSAGGFQVPKVCSADKGETFGYDALGRLQSRMHSDGNSVQYAYQGRATKVVEEGNGTASRTRILQSDALGRLTSVCEVTNQVAADGEVPTDCGLDLPGTGFLTSYLYDALGHLTSVQQGRLAARSYGYDTLGGLTSEFEPEAGSTTRYEYDNDGLLVRRVRPAPNQPNSQVTVTTTYAYDALHRLTSKSYSDGVTPTATFTYDDSSVGSLALRNTIGRLTAASTLFSTQLLTREARAYDPVGRVSNSYQWTAVGSQPSPFQLGYCYDFAGSMRFATNPAGVQFNYDYDDALRLRGLSSSASDANHPPFLLSNVRYGPFGPTSATIAGRLSEQMTYTPQGRPQTYTVTAPTNPPTVSVDPSSVQLQPSQTQQFVGSCTQGGSPCTQAVRWMATAGIVNGSGFYTAPLFVTGTTVATITACWAFSPEVCVSAQATITPVAVDQPPVARISASCNGLMCSFDASASSDDHGINSYLWTFGDGGFGIQRVSPHAYASSGTYTVQLTVYDTINQSNTATTTLTVTAADTPPTPFFTLSCTGRDCTFDGRGSTDDHGITVWGWNFGDGAGDSGNPLTSHRYAVNGTYTVWLTVTDTIGQMSSTNRTVTVSDLPPAASFTATCSGATCSFDGRTSTDDFGVTSWSWSFGDGGTAVGSTASHTYLASGTYTVQLTVTDTAGQTGTATRSVTVQRPPVPAFTVSCAGRRCDVDGSASSADLGLASFSWNFGDGTAPGSGVTASHVYAADNTFTITLTVADNSGATAQATHTVTVVDHPPTAGFDVVCTDLACHVDSETSSDDVGIAGYAWTWGDGQTSSGGSPFAATDHTYASYGTFTIGLTLTDIAGQTAGASRTVTLSPGLTAAFLVVGCSGRTCNVDASGSSGPITTYHWDWGDEAATDAVVPTASHTFASDDTFSIHLRVTDATGRFADVTHTVTVQAPPPGPTAAFVVVGCTALTCTVDASGSSGGATIASYHWDWGDETTTDAAAPTASHTFGWEDTFSIHLRVTDSLGQFADVTHTVSVPVPPVAAFVVLGCTGRTCNVDASGSSSGMSITSYHWDWDDETATDAPGPTASHTFAWDDTFRIHLRVTDSTGRFADMTHPVTVQPPVSGPTAAFIVVGCTNRTCSVDASGSSGTIATYHWDWGDESTTDAAGPTASHTFAWDDTFSIHLRVTDPTGQFADVTHPVTVLSPPAGPTATFVVVGCTGRTCSVNASGSSGTIASYHWDWGDETSTDAASATASHTYAWDDTFSIHLRVTDANGRFADVTHAVTVLLPPSGPTASFTVTCTGRSCSFNGSASTSNVAIVSYHWDWDDESTTDTAGPSASHRYSYGATFRVALAVTDANGAIGRITKSVTVP